jgi:hypothetical protein
MESIHGGGGHSRGPASEGRRAFLLGTGPDARRTGGTGPRPDIVGNDTDPFIDKAGAAR